MRDDQATGLRRLFAPASARTVSVAGEGATMIALELAAAAARLGRRVLLVDRSRGEAAAACGVKVRYGLAHLLAGDKAWREVAHAGPPGVTLLAASRGLDELDCEGRDWLGTIGARFDAAAGYDVWIVNGLPPTHGPDGDVLLPIAPTATAITGAYARIKALALGRGRREFGVVVHGARSETVALDAFRSVAETAQRFLRARLDYRGTIPVDVAPAPKRAGAMAPADSARGKAFLRLAETIAAAHAPQAIAC